jgi:hypothetical protein
MQWLRIESGDPNQIYEYPDKIGEQSAEDNGVLIGQWYYFLYVHGRQIDLCRTRIRKGLPSLTEVISPGQYAISDDDLDYAVQYWTSGTYEPGIYPISSLIERKLRIVFE